MFLTRRGKSFLRKLAHLGDRGIGWLEIDTTAPTAFWRAIAIRLQAR